MEPGTVLFGKYRVDEVIGTGGMGSVVRASHLSLQQPVAIKILLPQMIGSAETVSRFLREAQSTVRLRSEHIARVMDVGTMADGAPYMVMEYLDGSDLNQILRHHGSQPMALVCDLMLQACEGLAEAHSLGIIHRDIKPSNFFVTRRPDGSMLLKILDFGISKTPIAITELTAIDSVIGTPSYMSPEQMKNSRAADARSDIWSMGVVMYQLLEGRPPFSGESYAELVLKVGVEPPARMQVTRPTGLGELVMRCMEKDPRQRPQTVAELARMLAPFATDPIQAAQCAGRATRILQHTAGHGSPLSAGGGRLTPGPISPAQLTPQSPSPSSTGLSHGRGQVTSKVRSGRGWLIAGVTTLCIAAGAGGYVASEMRQGEAHDGTHVSAPPATAPVDVASPTQSAAVPSTPRPEGPSSATTEPEPEVTAPEVKPPEVKPEVKPEAKPPLPAFKTVAKVAVKATPRPVPKPVVKTATKPTKPTRPTKPTKPGSDDLFDSRH